MLDMLMSKDAMGFIAKIEDAFKSLPHMPKGFNEFLVKIAPWLAIIGAVLSVLAVPALLGVMALVSFTLSPLTEITLVIDLVAIIADAVLLFMAFGPLKNRELKGWVLLFWSSVLGIVSTVASVIDSHGGGVVTAIIVLLIRWYFLFEMKPYYDGKGVVAAVKKVVGK